MSIDLQLYLPDDIKSVKRLKQSAPMRQTDRPRYGKMCRNRRNQLRCQSIPPNNRSL